MQELLSLQKVAIHEEELLTSCLYSSPKNLYKFLHMHIDTGIAKYILIFI